MKRVLFVTLGIGISLILTRTVAAQDKAQIERGMKVYADQKCSICHSVAGKGNAKGALDSVGGKLKVEEIREWLVNPVEMSKQGRAERKPAI